MGVLYKEVKHIIDQQYEAESKFLEEYGKESLPRLSCLRMKNRLSPRLR